MSTSSSDAQSFISKAENESHRKVEMMMMVQCYLGQWHASSSSFFENNLRHKDSGCAVSKMFVELFLELTG